MSIDQTNIVDAIGTDNSTGHVMLTITDHLKLDDEDRNHLSLLQEKINTYLRFVDSGEILQTYPASNGKAVVIRVIGKYALSEAAKRFYKEAATTVEGAGLKLNFQKEL